MIVSQFRFHITNPVAAMVLVKLYRGCPLEARPPLPANDQIAVIVFADGTMKVVAGPNINLDETVEVAMKGIGTVESKTVQGRTIFTLVPREGLVLDGDKLVADLMHFAHLAQRQDPDVLRAEWEARQELREQRRDERGDKGNRPSRPRGEGQVKGPRKGNHGGAKPKAAPPVIPAPPSPAQRVNEKASEVIVRLMVTEDGRNAVAAARMACGVTMSGPIPAAKLKEVAEMAKMLVK